MGLWTLIVTGPNSGGRVTVVEFQSLRLPPGSRVPHRPGFVKRRVVQYHHDRLALPLGPLGQIVQVREHLPRPARALQHPVLQPLDPRRGQGEGADQVDSSLLSPPSPHPVLVLSPLPRPAVRGGQAQRDAALVQVLQNEFALRSPFFSASSSFRASRSSSGSGGLDGA